MESIVTENFLSDADIQYILDLPEVASEKMIVSNISPSGNTKFSILLTDSIRSTIESKWGIDTIGKDRIPMRWVKGDSLPHVDKGTEDFANSFLVYLTDSAGEFIIDNVSYPISKNTAFKFNEGLSHETTGTSEEPRLLLGPMSENLSPVGGNNVRYYASLNDAIGNRNSIGDSSYTVATVNGISIWRIASNSSGSSPQDVAYSSGDVLNSVDNPLYYLYPNIICFKEDTKILILNQETQLEEYEYVQNLRKGTLVKTLLNGYVPLHNIGTSTIVNHEHMERTEERLYKCSNDKYPELFEDLVITGHHCILVDNLTDLEKEKCIGIQKDVFVTDRKYRLPVCIDDRSQPYEVSGLHNIYNFALEHQDVKMNYEVYANGLLVETTSIRFIDTLSGYTLL